VIHRRAFLGTLGLLAAPLVAEAQPAAKAARIGMLTLAVGPSSPMAEAFRQGLREHGYVEGQHVTFEYRYAEGRAERLPALAAELVRRKVDVIVIESNVAALAAKRATQTIPIVMGIAGDPVKAGVVSNLGRPGGNVTGLTLIHPELSGKRLQLLKEAVRTLALVAIIWNPADPALVDYLPDTEAAARSLGLRIHAVAARSPMELEAAFKAVSDARPSAFFTFPGGLFLDNRTRIVDFATRNRLPGIFPSGAYAEAGGLMSYGPNLTATFHRAAEYVDRILKGAKPGELPIEQPTKFELVINLKTAKTLGLTIPPSLLLRADQVID
jgi:putative ABC transport system substrate-binding protein